MVDSFFDDDFTGLLVFNGIITRFRYDNNNKHNNDTQTNKQTKLIITVHFEISHP